MNTIRFRRVTRQVHRWLGLIIGLQVLMWVTGGFIMSLLKLQDVRGATWAAEQEPAVLVADSTGVDLGHLLEAHGDRGITEVTLHTFLDRPVYVLEGTSDTVMVDALTGKLRSPISGVEARAVAERDQAGKVIVRSVEWVTEPELEFRGRGVPIWRVWLDDGRNTAIYVAPDTGRVVARRNNLWRLFDFVWMLHIMDYEERDDFNHPLLVIFAASALLFVLSGGMMLALSFGGATRGRTRD